VGAVYVHGGHAEPVLLHREPGAIGREHAERRDNPVEHRAPGKDTASYADRSTVEDAVVYANRHADRRYQPIPVAADQVPVPAGRTGRSAKHSPSSALNHLTTPRFGHPAVDEVPQPKVKAGSLSIKWLPVFGEPSKRDQHRGSLSVCRGQ
jgi:hypothetical protein